MLVSQFCNQKVALYEGWPLLKGTPLYVGISVLQSKSGEVTPHIRPLLITELRYQHTKFSPSREVTPHIRPLLITELRYQHTKFSPSREVTP
jgi:hypothetical protein